jgi:hypothetical protein
MPYTDRIIISKSDQDTIRTMTVETYGVARAVHLLGASPMRMLNSILNSSQSTTGLTDSSCISEPH